MQKQIIIIVQYSCEFLHYENNLRCFKIEKLKNTNQLQVSWSFYTHTQAHTHFFDQ
jgi:hypothetical protein